MEQEKQKREIFNARTLTAQNLLSSNMSAVVTTPSYSYSSSSLHHQHHQNSHTLSLPTPSSSSPSPTPSLSWSYLNLIRSNNKNNNNNKYDNFTKYYINNIISSNQLKAKYLSNVISSQNDLTKSKRSADKDRESECEKFAIGEEGIKTFYSPGYPDEYTKNISCVRVIEGMLN